LQTHSRVDLPSIIITWIEITNPELENMIQCIIKDGKYYFGYLKTIQDMIESSQTSKVAKVLA
jgi:ribosomal protein L30E